MEADACLIVYCPTAGGSQPTLALSSDLDGARIRTEPDNERVSFVSRCGPAVTDFRSRVLSSLASAEAYVSQPLSSRRAVCLARVEGMVCHSCVQLIEATVSKAAGVHGVRVSLSGKEAMVEFDPSLTDSSAVVSAIDDMGFEAEHISTYTSGSLGDSVSVSVPLRNETGRREDVATVVVGVEGMVCQSCVSNIETNLRKVGGVEKISVSLADKNASITYDRGLLTVDQLCGAIEELGFEATSVPGTGGGEGEDGGGVRKCLVIIEGMTCHSCVGLIESVVGDLGGVVSVTVTLETKEGVVEYEEGRVGEEEIRSAIEDTGFEVASLSSESSPVTSSPQLNSSSSCSHFLPSSTTSCSAGLSSRLPEPPLQRQRGSRQ